MKILKQIGAVMFFLCASIIFLCWGLILLSELVKEGGATAVYDSLLYRSMFDGDAIAYIRDLAYAIVRYPLEAIPLLLLNIAFGSPVAAIYPQFIAAPINISLFVFSFRILRRSFRNQGAADK